MNKGSIFILQGDLTSGYSFKRRILKRESQEIKTKWGANADI
jgi:hypothetical protein